MEFSLHAGAGKPGMILGLPDAAFRIPAGQAAGLLLDGVHRGSVALRRRDGRVLVSLPTCPLARHADLLDLETGRSLLREPCFVLSGHALSTGAIVCTDGALCGEFSVLGLDDHVPVECLENGQVLARGFATRMDGAQYRFRLPFPTLLTPDRQVACLFRIAGLLLDGPPCC